MLPICRLIKNGKPVPLFNGYFVCFKQPIYNFISKIVNYNVILIELNEIERGMEDERETVLVAVVIFSSSSFFLHFVWQTVKDWCVQCCKPNADGLFILLYFQVDNYKLCSAAFVTITFICLMDRRE